MTKDQLMDMVLEQRKQLEGYQEREHQGPDAMNSKTTAKSSAN